MTQLLKGLALALAVTFAAGTTAFAQTSPDTGTQAPAATADPATEVCAADWATADANGDGSIKEDEASAELKAQFSMVDKDADGSITQEEYEACGKA